MRCAKLAGLRQRFLVGNGWPSSGENDYLYPNTAKRHCDDVLRVGVAFDIVSLVRDDDDVYYNIRWRLKLEREAENMVVCTKERKGVTAAVLMATPCTNSLGGESGGQKHEGCGGRSACWKFAAVSGSGAGGRRC